MSASAGERRRAWKRRHAEPPRTGGQRPVVEAPESSATLPRPKPVQMHVHPQDASTDDE